MSFIPTQTKIYLQSLTDSLDRLIRSIKLLDFFRQDSPYYKSLFKNKFLPKSTWFPDDEQLSDTAIEFRFTHLTPGVIYYRVTPTCQEQSMQLLKSVDRLPSIDGPLELKPPGLPLARQWYLFQKILEFTRDDAQDVTCPKPMIAAEGIAADAQEEVDEPCSSRDVIGHKRVTDETRKQTKTPSRSKRGRR